MQGQEGLGKKTVRGKVMTGMIAGTGIVFMVRTLAGRSGKSNRARDRGVEKCGGRGQPAGRPGRPGKKKPRSRDRGCEGGERGKRCRAYFLASAIAAWAAARRATGTR